MISFIFGPAGSGKSERVASLIENDIKESKKVFLIVPEQEAVTCERRMVARLGAAAQLDFEVLNFSRLSNRVFRKYGGLSYNYASEGTKALIMWETMRELAPHLAEYRENADDSGIFELMLATVGELKRYSVTPGKLENAAKKLPADSSLKKKISDISLIYSFYNALLLERYEDSSDDLLKLSAILDENDFFSGHNVYIDSYSSFTPEEYKIIYRIFEQADNVTLALGCDLPDGSFIHFESIYDTARTLISGAKARGLDTCNTVLSGNLRAKNEDLKFLSENLWRQDGSVSPYEGEIRSLGMVEASDPFAVSEAIAADILEKVRQGARYRDFAVIGRSSGELDGIVSAVFEKHGIPYYLSGRTDIDTFPLIKLIYTAFAIKKGNWRLFDVISYMRTGLCKISPSECDIFEEYASAWNICGSRYTDGYDWNMNPDGFVPELSERAKSVLISVNETKKKLTEPLMAFFAKIGGHATAHEFNLALYEFLCELGISDTLICESEKRKDAGNAAEAAELIRLWNVVVDTLDDIDTAIPDAILDASDYLQILRMMFERTDIGTIPTTTDEVTLGGADMLRADRPKYVYVFGLNDGVFPRPVSDTGIFSDNDKKTLEALGVELSPDTKRSSAEEMLYCYRALCAPSDELCLLYWTHSMDGAAARPSVAAERVKKLFPELEIKKYGSGEVLPFVPSKEGAFEYLFASDDPETREALYEYFSADESYKELLTAYDTPLVASDCTVLPESARDIWGKNMRLSQSKIDTYVLCPFSYYGNYVLRLRENCRAEFRYNDIGTFVHEILERFLRETRNEDGSFDHSLSDAELERIADELIEDYLKKLSSDGGIFSNRLKNLFMRLRRAIMLLIKNLSAEFSQSDFSPALFELGIDYSEEGIPPLEIKLSDGAKVSVVGKIDRVDTYEKDGRMYVRVVDYKTGTKDFSLDDVRQGLGIQMLLYLFTIWKGNSTAFLKKVGADEIEEILPAGVLYSSVQPPEVSLSVKCADDETIAAANAKLTRKGLLIDDTDILSAMEKDMAGRYIPVKLNKNGTLAASSSIASLESFGELYGELSEIIKKISEQMRSGAADARPLKKGPNDAPCRYCKMKPFCRSAVKCNK